jgi:hypothetical protein
MLIIAIIYDLLWVLMFIDYSMVNGLQTNIKNVVHIRYILMQVGALSITNEVHCTPCSSNRKKIIFFYFGL